MPLSFKKVFDEQFYPRLKQLYGDYIYNTGGDYIADDGKSVDTQEYNTSGDFNNRNMINIYIELYREELKSFNESFGDEDEIQQILNIARDEGYNVMIHDNNSGHRTLDIWDEDEESFECKLRLNRELERIMNKGTGF